VVVSEPKSLLEFNFCKCMHVGVLAGGDREHPGSVPHRSTGARRRGCRRQGNTQSFLVAWLSPILAAV
jgi:hypothetical protein